MTLSITKDENTININVGTFDSAAATAILAAHSSFGLSLDSSPDAASARDKLEIQDFETRAGFLSWASGKTLPYGHVKNVAGQPMAYLNFGPDDNDAPGWTPAGSINVKYFGAKGNGTDCTSALLDAATYLNETPATYQGRPALYFPGGEYLVSSTINWIGNFTKLIGDGSRATLIAQRSDFGDVFTIKSSDPTASSVQGCGVSGMAFRAFVDTNSGAQLRLVRCSQSQFNDLNFFDGFGGFKIEGGQHQQWSNINVITARNTIWSGLKTGSFGGWITEGPASNAKTPSPIFFTNMNIGIASSETQNWIDSALLVECVDGLWLSNVHLQGGGGNGGLVLSPIVTALSPTGSQVTAVMSSSLWLDGGSRIGIRMKGTSNAYGKHMFSNTQWLNNVDRAVVVETGCNVDNVQFVGGTTQKSGLSAVYIDGGSDIHFTGVQFSASGDQLVTGDRAGVRYGPNALRSSIIACKFNNNVTGSSSDSTNQINGVIVDGGANDITVALNHFRTMTRDIVDDLSDDSDGLIHMYYGNSTDRTSLNLQTSANSLQLGDDADYYECDTDTSDVTGMVRRRRHRQVTIRFRSTRWLRHTTNQFNLRGGIDVQVNDGDVFTFRYESQATVGRGWVEVSRSLGNTPTTDTAMMLAGDQTVTGAKTFSGDTKVTKFGANGSVSTTISAGVITATSSYHLVDTEGAAATDDLDTINGGYNGMILVLGTVNSARDVTIKNGTGNIFCGADRVLDTVGDKITLMCVGSQWHMMAYSNN